MLGVFPSIFLPPVRAYSRPLLGATIAPNLVPWVLKKIFSLEIDIFTVFSIFSMFRRCKQTKCPFFRKCTLKNAPMPSMFRTGPASKWC